MKARKKLSDLVFRYIVFLFTIVTVIAVIMIGVYMFRSGGPSIAKVGIKNFLFGKTWDTSVEPAKYGIFSFLSASVISMLGTVIVTVPVSILAAVGMSHFIPRPIASVLRTVISMLAGIPSVIYGFLGMILLVPFVQELFKLPAGLTLLSAIVVLVVMTLPTIISVSESSITAVPKDYMEASLALGVNKDYTILHIIIPAAKSGILSAILLGLGRAVGETMAVIMVAGNVAQMPKLLERAGTNEKGSITGLYTVLVDGDDFNEPITDTARGILDGHIVLDRKLGHKNHYPAIDILQSISRVMNSIVTKEHKALAGKLKQVLATYSEAEDLINIGAYKNGSNPDIDYAIRKNKEVNEFLCQDTEEKFAFDEEVELLKKVFDD